MKQPATAIYLLLLAAMLFLAGVAIGWGLCEAAHVEPAPVWYVV